MFFFFGIMDDKKDLNVMQRLNCAARGRIGNIQVVVTHTVLLIFFIPCFKWRQYAFCPNSPEQKYDRCEGRYG